MPVFVDGAFDAVVSPGPPADADDEDPSGIAPSGSRVLVQDDTGLRMIDLDAERLVASFPGHDLSTALNTPDGGFVLVAEDGGGIVAVDWLDSFRSDLDLDAAEAAAVVTR